MGSLILLDLMGGVALLLWGLHMVQSGVMRAFGTDLRGFLGGMLKNRFSAFAAGVAVTTLLQSSTATGLMATSFTAEGVLPLVPALALMLGANVGTTLIVQALSFDVTAVSPVLFIIGLFAFKQGASARIRNLGRITIGLGLMLLSLHILLDTLAPAETAPVTRTLLGAITAEPLLNVLIAAALTWAAHSSVAVVLLVMSLGYAHFVTPVAALALVLGANLGSAINPLLEGGNAANPATRRLPLGNLANRVIGCLIALPFLHPIANALAAFDPNPAHQAAYFHTAFNLSLALVFIFPLDAVAKLLTRLLPERLPAADIARPLYLDEAALQSPAVALACAARETLHMGDVVGTMLRRSMTALMTDDRKLASEICRMDDAADKLEEAIKLYVTKLTRESLDEKDARRAMEIISFSINLEHMGDIIDKNLMELAVKKIKHRLRFSPEGAAELAAFHARVCESLTLAFGVFMSGDAKLARRLIQEKAELREAELQAAESHLARLRAGRLASIETSSLHLDVLRDLKRVHSHICSVAYPVLDSLGALQPHRLREVEARAAEATSPHDTPDPIGN
jgi:phosphate:Na+ symporter